MIPSFDPALFWNTIFDKGLLTVVVLVAAHLANRYLEKYRSERALITEAAKERLSRIGALWEELHLWERDFGRLFVEFCGITLKALQEAQIPGLPSKEEIERLGAVKTLMGLENPQIPREVEESLAKQFSPRNAKLARRASEIGRHIDRNRFWLGDDLFDAMKTYHLKMQQTMIILEPSRASMQQFKSAYDELAKSRETVDDVLARLLGRKAAGSRS
jgi:hypothetical protein